MHITKAARNFIRHYVEMLVAMALGMLVLGLPLSMVLSDPPAAHLLGMAFAMTVPMVAWMRYRGHGWAPASEMAASMFVPTFAAIGLRWGGLVEDVDVLLGIQHVAMLPSMLVAMLLRRDEYTGHAGHAVGRS
jgi:flagellar biosynthetic protein FliP